VGLAGRYLKLLLEFRSKDLVEFLEVHDRLFAEARKTGDHRPATSAYYEMMGPIIETYYGAGWHFCPPDYPGQSRDDAVRSLHHRIARLLGLRSGMEALDVGCGVGGMMRGVSLYSGSRVTGLTLGEGEVRSANQSARDAGLSALCSAVQGDCLAMPFDAESFDAAYAVYALKYYPDLSVVLGEIQRVLRPKALFAAYCLGRTDDYEPDNPEHAQISAEFEYATAMPPLPTVARVVASAEAAGLTCVTRMDISQETTWYHYWTANPILLWLVSSSAVGLLVRCLEAVRILPRGFARFNDIFLAGTIRLLVAGGRKKVLSGSTLLVFENTGSAS
jgi:ubiquinone/menaquinone biosynthesis C-methylase UbiE